jgi:hypothetical protein
MSRAEDVRKTVIKRATVVRFGGTYRRRSVAGGSTTDLSATDARGQRAAVGDGGLLSDHQKSSTKAIVLKAFVARPTGSWFVGRARHMSATGLTIACHHPGLAGSNTARAMALPMRSLAA